MEFSKQKKWNFVLILVATLSIFSMCLTVLPKQAFAQTCPADKQVSEGLSGGFGLFRGGLVPCGRQCDDPGTFGSDETQPCTLCHLIILVYNIYTLLLALLIIVALLFLTIGGVTYIVSSGNSSLKSYAKNIVTKTLVGFAVFLLSWLIVYAVLFFISANPDGNSMLGRGTGGFGWYQYQCNISSVFTNVELPPGEELLDDQEPPDDQESQLPQCPQESGVCFACTVGTISDAVGETCADTGGVSYDCSWVCSVGINHVRCTRSGIGSCP